MSPGLFPELNAIVDSGLAIRFEDLPAVTVAAVEARIVDVVGCALGGFGADGNMAIRELVGSWGGTPEATVLGTTTRLPAVHAAMVNAIAARSYDFEVMSVLIGDRLIPSHHAATTVMTALALAEANQSSGQDFVTAIAVGDDLSARLLAASGLDFTQGWDGSAVYSAPGAALIAAKLLGFSREQALNAVSLAIAQISHTIEDLYDGGTSFKLGQGTAARNAILAAGLAARGWTGMKDALGGRYGFFRQYTAGCADRQILTSDLGRTFYGEAYFKPYPSCMATHVALECALGLREKSPVDPAGISAVTVRMPAPRLDNFCGKPFEAREFPHCDAIFSYRYPVALALANGRVAQDDYSNAAIRSPEIARLCEAIGLEALADDRKGVEIEIAQMNGEFRRHYHEHLRHDPRFSSSHNAHADAKFIGQAQRSGLDEDAAIRCLDAVRGISSSRRVLCGIISVA